MSFCVHGAFLKRHHGRSKLAQRNRITFLGCIWVQVDLHISFSFLDIEIYRYLPRSYSSPMAAQSMSYKINDFTPLLAAACGFIEHPLDASLTDGPVDHPSVGPGSIYGPRRRMPMSHGPLHGRALGGQRPVHIRSLRNLFSERASGHTHQHIHLFMGRRLY